jgi:hypothetical protein
MLGSVADAEGALLHRLRLPVPKFQHAQGGAAMAPKTRAWVD